MDCRSLLVKPNPMKIVPSMYKYKRTLRARAGKRRLIPDKLNYRQNFVSLSVLSPLSPSLSAAISHNFSFLVYFPFSVLLAWAWSLRYCSSSFIVFVFFSFSENLFLGTPRFFLPRLSFLQFIFSTICHSIYRLGHLSWIIKE